MIDCYTVIFLLVEAATIFREKNKLTIIIPSYCYPLVTKQNQGNIKWFYENIRVGNEEIWAKQAEINFLKDKQTLQKFILSKMNKHSLI